MNTKFDLCVVNFNTLPELQRLVFSLNRDDELFQLHIFDNASTEDDSVSWLAEHGETLGAKVTLNKGNIGYARACNRMASQGSGEIIALLNSDVWFTNNDLLSIYKTFEDHREVAILGPKQINEVGDITHAGIEGTEAKPKLRAWKQHDPHNVKYRELEEMVSVSGSAYFIRRSVWNRLLHCGIFKQSFPDVEGAFLPTPHYYEETWCSYHARAHGFKVFYEGRVSIGHTWHASHAINSEYDKLFKLSQGVFRMMCNEHNIEHD